MMQCAVSLIVCNLAVIVTFIYRFIRNGEDTEHSSDATTVLRTRHSGGGGHKIIANDSGLELNATQTSFWILYDPGCKFYGRILFRKKLDNMASNPPSRSWKQLSSEVVVRQLKLPDSKAQEDLEIFVEIGVTPRHAQILFHLPRVRVFVRSLPLPLCMIKLASGINPVLNDQYPIGWSRRSVYYSC
jgi:hypothetical protein